MEINKLFSFPGLHYLLSDKLSQDPIEGFFVKQRAAGGRSDNPECQGIVLKSIRVQNSALEPVRSNCGWRQAGEINEKDLNKPLPK